MSNIQNFSAHWLSETEIPLANKFYRSHKFRGKARRHDPCAVIKNTQQEIIACGCLRLLTEGKLLAGVAVAPDYQGQGLARLLLSNMAKAFDNQTFTFPYRHLVPFYQSLGFVEEDIGGQPSAILDRFHTYRRQGRDIVLMHYP
ncbi:GNAT family N-acetyltransferase [Microbulbifer thermotolerans]|uniref:GNAT family N-acetyltransferase n=1 Tax=Microbulbifer thermotolerans TaxID=252514 RepID=UPI002248BDB2|nr:GNAT family N-acetyltransferase [Microbulbifer thermotolerans]MCX2779116.1 GNAT family N-acetyltransferase [Microbulbifer thermotolerans]MCX2805252.1 GNAT family N-acetyltransferase [Microbulbifer thermotolerans]MCX2831767.1 GNAT family N-acetyltransferase [Microbulbifer thermotolerans]MCX2835123.1 GNAT family N-acetyltransferase [Microbulbifer thermotolerans]